LETSTVKGGSMGTFLGNRIRFKKEIKEELNNF